MFQEEFISYLYKNERIHT